jgi:hypothetical protein
MGFYESNKAVILTILLEKVRECVPLIVFNQQGRTVKTGNLDGKQTTLELNGLSGMYYLMVGQEVVKVQVVK